MPAVSKKQQAFFGAELARKRAGKSTKTGMSAGKLKDFAATPRKGLPVMKGPKKGSGQFEPAVKKPDKMGRYS